MQIPADVLQALTTLLNEVLDGPPGREAYLLNGGDRGLLGSLEQISAAEASAAAKANVAATATVARTALAGWIARMGASVGVQGIQPRMRPRCPPPGVGGRRPRGRKATGAFPRLRRRQGRSGS